MAMDAEGAGRASSVLETAPPRHAGPGARRGQVSRPSRPAQRMVGRPDRSRQIGARQFLARRWPLLTVLGVQAALSLKLVWSNSAFQDEALYLRAGHLELAHWLHGTAIPDFPSYFSGAPVL